MNPIMKAWLGLELTPDEMRVLTDAVDRDLAEKYRPREPVSE